MSTYQPMIARAAERMRPLRDAHPLTAGWSKKLDFMAGRIPAGWADDSELDSVCSELYTESVAALHEAPDLPGAVGEASEILAGLVNQIEGV
jgi:hypothetical protein